MVEVEPTAGNPVELGELVQFVEGAIAHEVTPEGVVRRPPRLVDEHGHGAIIDNARRQNHTVREAPTVSSSAAAPLSAAARAALRRRGIVSAAAVSTAVLIALVITAAIQAAVAAAQASAAGIDLVQYIASAGPSALLLGAAQTLPFALGVFVSLWQFAPIGPELRVGHVLTRATLATGVGSVSSVLVLFVVALVTTIPAIGGSLVRGLGFADASEELRSTAVSIAATTVGSFVGALPLVALACVLLWSRLRERGRPFTVEGLLDV